MKTHNQMSLPCWADVTAMDPPASAAFYEELFQWRTTPGSGPESVDYSTFALDGRKVGGISPCTPEIPRPTWLPYVRVADADETVLTVLESGGALVEGPVEINDLGCLAVVTDPDGAMVGVWQPEALLGADVIGLPGSMCWNELQTHDVDRARRFYGQVFDWTASEPPASSRYTEWHAQGLPCGGMTLVDSRAPARWLTYVGVTDCDAAAEKCEGRGGTVQCSPADTSRGRSAVLSDPQGATFAITAPRSGDAMRAP